MTQWQCHILFIWYVLNKSWMKMDMNSMNFGRRPGSACKEEQNIASGFCGAVSTVCKYITELDTCIARQQGYMYIHTGCRYSDIQVVVECVHMYISACMYTYIHGVAIQAYIHVLSVCICMCTYAHTYIHTCIKGVATVACRCVLIVCKCVCTYTHAYTYIACTGVWECADVCICIYTSKVYMCMSIHIHVCRRTFHPLVLLFMGLFLWLYVCFCDCI